MTLKMLTELEKERIINLPNLEKEIKWRAQNQIDKKAVALVDDLIFLLGNKETIGPLNEMIGQELCQKLLKLIISDIGMEYSLLTPDFAVSIIEENRVLANIIAKKNAVWRDLVAKVNSAKDFEDFVRQITSRENVYLVEGENVRVHIRR